MEIPWPLCDAIQTENHGRLANLLKETNPSLPCDARGNFPISLAVESGNLLSCQMLLEAGADPWRWRPLAYAPAQKAIHKDRADLLEALLSAGSSPIPLLRGERTLLHWAARLNAVACCQLLVALPEKRIDPLALDTDKLTALQSALSFSAFESFQCLLDVPGLASQPWTEGYTVAHQAVWAQDISFGLRALQEMARRELSLDQPSDNGRTPLHEAACLGRFDCGIFLLGHGANALAVDANGQTPLDVFPVNPPVGGQEALFLELLTSGMRRQRLEAALPGDTPPTGGLLNLKRRI